MSYENAKSTILLATECVCCGRPLRDAISVEAGVGPDCRARHGYADAQGVADWQKALGALGADGGLFGSNGSLTPVWGIDAQRAANILVHHAACLPRDERAPFVAAIAALGYVRLATKMARAAGEVIEVMFTAQRDRYVVKTPYSAEFVDGLKMSRIGARWDKTIEIEGARKPGAWTVPTDRAARVGLFAVLKRTFAGATLASEKGLTTI